MRNDDESRARRRERDLRRGGHGRQLFAKVCRQKLGGLRRVEDLRELRDRALQPVFVVVARGEVERAAQVFEHFGVAPLGVLADGEEHRGLRLVVVEAACAEVLKRRAEVFARLFRFALRDEYAPAREYRPLSAHLVARTRFYQAVEQRARFREVAHLQGEQTTLFQKLGARYLDARLVVRARGAVVELDGAREFLPLAVEVPVALENLAAQGGHVEELADFERAVEMASARLEVAEVPVAARDVEVRD